MGGERKKTTKRKKKEEEKHGERRKEKWGEIERERERDGLGSKLAFNPKGRKFTSVSALHFIFEEFAYRLGWCMLIPLLHSRRTSAKSPEPRFRHSMRWQGPSHTLRPTEGFTISGSPNESFPYQKASPLTVPLFKMTRLLDHFWS